MPRSPSSSTPPRASATPTEPITMDEINEVLTASAAKGARRPRRARPHPRHLPGPRPRDHRDPRDHRMSRLRIENACHVARSTTTDTDPHPTRPSRSTTASSPRSPPRPDGARRRRGRRPTVDARGKLLMPGLVNLHTHLPMTLLRGLAENVDLQGFLSTRLGGRGEPSWTRTTVELGATLGALESRSSAAARPSSTCTSTTRPPTAAPWPRAAGTSSGRSSSTAPGPTASPGRSASPTCAPGPALLDRDRRPRRSPSRRCRTPPTRAPPRASPRSSPCCARSSPTTGRPGLLTTHVSENPAENAGMHQRYERPRPGCSPGRLGRARPAARRRARRAPQRARPRSCSPPGGQRVGHCPGSNLKLASGALPWEVGARQRRSGRDRHRRMLELQRPRHVAGDAPGRTARPPDERPPRRRERHRGAACRDHRGCPGHGARRRDRVGRGGKAGRPRAPRPRCTAPDAGPRRRAALLVFAAGRGDVTDVLVDGASWSATGAAPASAPTTCSPAPAARRRRQSCGGGP